MDSRAGLHTLKNRSMSCPCWEMKHAHSLFIAPHERYSVWRGCSQRPDKDSVAESTLPILPKSLYILEQNPALHALKQGTCLPYLLQARILSTHAEN